MTRAPSSECHDKQILPFALLVHLPSCSIVWSHGTWAILLNVLLGLS